jgi:hypothetical protein
MRQGRARCSGLADSHCVWAFRLLSQGGSWGQCVELDEDAEEIGDPPVIGELSVLDAEDVYGVEVDSPAGRGYAEKLAMVGAVVGLVGGDFVGIDCLPMDLGIQIGKCCAQAGVELADAVFVGGDTGLRSVVDEVVGEQFLEGGEVSSALNFFGVASDDPLEGIGFVCHDNSLTRWAGVR